MRTGRKEGRTRRNERRRGRRKGEGGSFLRDSSRRKGRQGVGGDRGQKDIDRMVRYARKTSEKR